MSENKCKEHKWKLAESKTYRIGYRNHDCKYVRLSTFYCERCLEMKDVQDKAEVSPFGLKEHELPYWAEAFRDSANEY